jgi:TatD DNase family protein
MIREKPMRGVDFHCHLDLYPDFTAAVAQAEASEIYTLTVTTTPKAWPKNHELTRDTRFVRAALGLHPQLVAGHASELDLWEQYLPQTRYVGEVGLDAGPRFYRTIEEQKRVFRFMLRRCADAGGKILSVHSVRSASQVLDMLEAELPTERGKVVLHWFTGTKAEARRAADLGCYFSLNAEMGRTARGIAVIQNLPSDRILTETDGPFTKSGGRPAQPSDVLATCAYLAELRKISTETFAHSVRANLKALLGPDSSMA